MVYFSEDDAKARRLLEEGEYSCVLVKGGAAVCKDKKGIAPLVELIDSGLDCKGFAAADKVVGKAAALLFVLLGVRSVYATVLSRAAEAVFKKYSIEYTCGTLADYIVNRQNTGSCPMEQAVCNIDRPAEALLKVRETLVRLKSQTRG